jgi:hypothetical protein
LAQLEQIRSFPDHRDLKEILDPQALIVRLLDHRAFRATLVQRGSVASKDFVARQEHRAMLVQQVRTQQSPDHKGRLGRKVSLGKPLPACKEHKAALGQLVRTLKWLDRKA